MSGPEDLTKIDGGTFGLAPDQIARINAFMVFLGTDWPSEPLAISLNDEAAVAGFFQDVTRDLVELWLAVQRAQELHGGDTSNEAWLACQIVTMGSKRFQEALRGLR